MSILSPPHTTIPSGFNGASFGGFNDNWNGTLVECSFRSIPFPIESVEIDLSQSIVQHKQPNVDGAKIEGTGRDPLVFKVKAILLNGLFRSKIETWDNLFPETFTKLFQALMDNSAGTFIHPTLGAFNVKPVRGGTTTSATTRNGHHLDFELIEANADQTADAFKGASLGEVQNSAAALAAFMSTELPLNDTPDLFSLISDITKAIYGVRGTILNANDAISKALYTVNAIGTSISSLTSTSSAIARQNLERIRSGLYQLEDDIFTQQATLSQFIVRAPMTLSGVATAVATPVDTLITLNPTLVRTMILPVGTSVKFPRAA